MTHWWAGLGDLTSLSAAGLLVVVLTLVFVESGLLIGFFLPGDSVLFAAGLLAADPRRGVSVPLLAGGVALAAVAGDAVGYWSGRRFGRPWLLRRAGRAAGQVQVAERFFHRWGSLAVIGARSVPWIRTFTPILAGVARMRYPTFLLANVIGALLWGSGLVLLGQVAYAHPAIRWLAYAVAGLAVLASVLVPAAGWVSSANRSPERPAPAPARPAGHPVPAARSNPPLAAPDRNRHPDRS